MWRRVLCVVSAVSAAAAFQVADGTAAAGGAAAGGTGGTTFYYHGSIQNVIAGKVPQPLGTSRVDPAVPYYGFSVGSRDALDAMGNMVVVNGVVHNRDTNASAADYYSVVAGPEPFLSTSSVYLLPGARPDLAFSLANASMEYTRVTQSLYDLAGGRPHCYVGLAAFRRLQGVALTKSPVFGENIFANKSAYFAEPPCCLNASQPSGGAPVPATLMGCAANLRDESNSTLKALLERVLYVNPFGVAENLTVHVEVMQLDRAVSSLSEIGAGDGVAIDHMLSQSVVSDLDVQLFYINDLQPLSSVDGAVLARKGGRR